MDLLVAAVVGAARGLKGEVFIEVRTDRPEQVFEAGRKLEVEAPPAADTPQGSSLPKTVTVRATQTHSGRRSVRFDEITTREEAEAMRGAQLLTEPVAEDDAWYPHELQGLTVYDPAGVTLGTVSGIAQGAAHDLLLVRVEDQSERMVPFVREVVPVVSVAEGRVVVDAPAGLLD